MNSSFVFIMKGSRVRVGVTGLIVGEYCLVLEKLS
jgi:hypothetical protein